MDMDKMGDKIMKTLEQILKKYGSILTVKECVKEWLQQYDEDWSINGLLEQLDQ